MVKTPSKISGNRKSGKHQADELRTRILEAAEQLFLANGIETTSMADISARLGISRVTMYRYFANRDEIAVEIQIRMLEKINAVPPIDPDMPALDRPLPCITQNAMNGRKEEFWKPLPSWKPTAGCPLPRSYRRRLRSCHKAPRPF